MNEGTNAPDPQEQKEFVLDAVLEYHIQIPESVVPVPVPASETRLTDSAIVLHITETSKTTVPPIPNPAKNLSTQLQQPKLFRRSTPPSRCVLKSRPLRITVSPSSVVDAYKTFSMPRALTTPKNSIHQGPPAPNTGDTDTSTVRKLCLELELLPHPHSASTVASPAVGVAPSSLITPSPMSICTPMAPHKPPADPSDLGPRLPFPSLDEPEARPTRQRRGGAFARTSPPQPAPGPTHPPPPSAQPVPHDPAAAAAAPPPSPAAKRPKRSLFELLRLGPPPFPDPAAGSGSPAGTGPEKRRRAFAGRRT